MYCPSCGHSNPEEAEFCGDCGSRLESASGPSPYRFEEAERPLPSLVDRMIGASRLDAHVYEEVEADPRAMPQALMAVVVVGLASGIGLLGAGGGIGGLILGVIGAAFSWAVWAYLTYAIGTKVLPTPQTHATWGQLLRTTGFAQSPGVLRILGFIPVIGPVIFFAANVWQLMAMVVAVRQALDYDSTMRAVGVVAIGFVIVFIVTLVLSLLVGGFGGNGG